MLLLNNIQVQHKARVSRPKDKEIFEGNDKVSFYEHDKMDVDICSEIWYNAKYEKNRGQHQTTQIFLQLDCSFLSMTKEVSV